MKDTRNISDEGDSRLENAPGPYAGRIGCAADLFKDFDWEAWDALDAEVAKLWNWQKFD